MSSDVQVVLLVVVSISSDHTIIACFSLGIGDGCGYFVA